MHELSLIESLMNVAQQNSQGKRVVSVTMMVGSLSCVMVEALQFCFEQTKAGTCLEHAKLLCEIEPARAVCNHCGNEFVPQEMHEPCACGSFDKRWLSGRDIVIQSMEII